MKVKKTLFVFIIFFGAILFLARGQNKFQNGEYDVLVRIEGKVNQIRDSIQIRLAEPIVLNNGTVVNTDGTYFLVDREIFQLLDGESFDDEGTKYGEEYEYRYKIQQESKGLDRSEAQKILKNRFLVMLIKGEVYRIMVYEQFEIQEPVDLGYGKVVSPNGIHRTSYGRSRLKEGGCINLYGRPLINLYEHRKIIIRKDKRAAKKALKIK